MKITQKELSALVEEPYRSRGQDYFQKGLVELTTLKPQNVKAKAMGTGLYHVTLKRQAQGIVGNCTCPAFEGFGPCKHIAAVGFALIHQEMHGEYEPSGYYFARAEEYKAVERMLLKFTKQELIAFILQLANDDPEILERIGAEYC